MLPSEQVLLTRSVFEEEAPMNAHHSSKHFFTAPRLKVVENRELRGELDGGSTRHLEVDIHNTNINYETADNLAAMPENDENTVSKLASVMGWTLTEGFDLIPNSLTHSDYKHTFPTPCSVHEALSCVTDLHGMPRRTSLKVSQLSISCSLCIYMCICVCIGIYSFLSLLYILSRSLYLSSLCKFIRIGKLSTHFTYIY